MRMTTAADADEVLARVHEMDREQVVRVLTHFSGRIRVDFTPAYLESLSLDRLRHLLQAVLLRLTAA